MYILISLKLSLSPILSYFTFLIALNLSDDVVTNEDAALTSFGRCASDAGAKITYTLI